MGKYTWWIERIFHWERFFSGGFFRAWLGGNRFFRGDFFSRRRFFDSGFGFGWNRLFGWCLVFGLHLRTGALLGMFHGTSPVSPIWSFNARYMTVVIRYLLPFCDSPNAAAWQGLWRADCTQLTHCSKPCIKISLGKSIPMNTILLIRFSFFSQGCPKSLPINWCTPWKITLRSVPFMCNTPL